VTLIRDSELAYIMTRYRQAHDFWHALTGLSQVSIEQELALKAFEYVQFGMPAALISSIVGSFKLSMEERDRLYTIYFPWALRSARNAKCLLSVYYEEKFEMPLAALQSELRLEPFPE
jgi:ubiquinone biosynthesis protein COQ4